MSQAFVRENDDNGMLHQINPTLPALLRYLQVENNGQRVSLVKEEKRNGVDVKIMSNGFSYFINNDNNWEIMF